MGSNQNSKLRRRKAAQRRWRTRRWPQVRGEPPTFAFPSEVEQRKPPNSSQHWYKDMRASYWSKLDCSRPASSRGVSFSPMRLRKDATSLATCASCENPKHLWGRERVKIWGPQKWRVAFWFPHKTKLKGCEKGCPQKKTETHTQKTRTHTETHTQLPTHPPARPPTHARTHARYGP